MNKANNGELWSEDEYFGLDDPFHRIELLDGALWHLSVPTFAHQSISFRLITSLLTGTDPARLRIAAGINVRLGPGRRVIPDLVVGTWSRDTKIAEATDIVLIGEITSPGNADQDRLTKRTLYAEAGIPWYLLVDRDFRDYDSITLGLLRLADEGYVEHAVAERGETLTSRLPFALAIDTDWLLAF
jgi:Uma2 family endonuclease